MTQSSASDRKSIRAQEKKSLAIDVSRGDFIRSMMSTVEGRVYVHEFLTRCHCFDSTFNLNPLQTAFAEGERNIGLQLLNDVMRFIPDQYLPMMREANVRHDPISGRPGTNPEPASGSPSDELNGGPNSRRDVEGPDDSGGDYDPYSEDYHLH